MEKVGFVVQEEDGVELRKTIVKNGKEIEMWVLRLYLTDVDVEGWEIVQEATPLPSLLVK
jgi:hypothetical protein